MANKIDPREDYLLTPDVSLMTKEFQEGKQTGEDGKITAIRDQFSWKRTFVNCWTGNPNAGKTTMLNFLASNKSVYDDWKWCIWSREMISSFKDNGKIYITASDIYDELIHMYTGKNPYKHFEERFGIPQMSYEEYMNALEWVEDHFYVIDPKEKKYNTLIDTYNYFYEKFGFDGWIIDPFKNIRLPDGRTDEVLHQIFDDFKECALNTDSSINIVAHPRSIKEPKKENGAYKVVTQFDLLGGSAWNNSMDGIFSMYRPQMHKDPNDRRTWLYHLKQRKKHLVGETGVYKKIEFDWKTNRFYFDGYCPIDGSFMEPIGQKEKNQEKRVNKKTEIQTGLEFDEKDLLEYGLDDDEAPF